MDYIEYLIKSEEFTEFCTQYSKELSTYTNVDKVDIFSIYQDCKNINEAIIIYETK